MIEEQKKIAAAKRKLRKKGTSDFSWWNC